MQSEDDVRAIARRLARDPDNIRLRSMLTEAKAHRTRTREFEESHRAEHDRAAS